MTAFRTVEQFAAKFIAPLGIKDPKRPVYETKPR